VKEDGGVLSGDHFKRASSQYLQLSSDWLDDEVSGMTWHESPRYF